jgi:hypothetical protein
MSAPQISTKIYSGDTLPVVPPNFQAVAVQDGITSSRGKIVEADLVESDAVMVELRFVVHALASSGFPFF